MAVTDQQKLDFLLKKIGYTKTKTGSVVGTGAISGTGKQPFAEAIPSPLIIANSALWNESGSIPATPPGSDTSQVKVYLAGTSGLRMTADSTSSGQRAYIAYTTYGNTSSARLTNWIDTQFGASYLIKVYKGDPNSGGVALSAAGSGSNDGWFFDYSAGTLNFNDTNVPSGVTDTNIYIVGYRYIGSTGAPTPGTSTFNFTDLTISRNLSVGGISTFTGNIDANGNLDVDGQTDLDVLNVAETATFSSNIDANGDLDVDGHTNLDNVSIAGVTTFASNINGTTANFSGDVSIGGVLTYEDVKNVDSVGLITARSGIIVTGGVIEAQAGQNKIPSLYANMGALPSAGSYHGMFAHVHSTGRGYFAHAGNWFELVNREISGVVGTGTETYNIGNLVSTSSTATSLNVSGVTTAVTLDVNGDLDVDGHTNLDNVSIAGVTTHNEDVVFTGANTNARWDHSTSDLILFDNTRLEFGSNKDFEIWHGGAHTYLKNSGGDLRIRGDKILLKKADDTETYLEANVNSDVKLFFNSNEKFATTISGVNIIGHVETDTLQVSGLSTFTGNIDANGDLDVDGQTNLDHVSISGVTTFTSALNIDSDIDVDGHTNLDNVSIAGVTTFAGTVNTASIVATGIDLNGDIDVDGHTNLDNVSVAGVTTFASTAEFDGTAKFDSSITAGGVTGNNGQYLKTTGSGVAWATFPSLRTRDTQTASAGQTSFSFNYNVGLIDVFVNGVKLTDSEFTATNGTSVVLSVGSFVGDIIELVSYNTVSASGGAQGIGNLVEDVSPQLGGNLDLFNKSITGTGGANISGVVTATKFFGDGSGLTGVTASGSGVVIKDSGTTVGTAQTINFGDNLDVTPVSAGIVTITGSAGVETSQFNVNKLDVSGISTFKSAVDINADIDVDGHTNLDNVSIAGVSTFTGNADFSSGVDVTGTITGNNLTLSDNDPELTFTDLNNNPDYRIKAESGNLSFEDTTNGNVARLKINADGHVDVTGNLDVGAGIDVTGALSASDIRSNALTLKNAAGSASYAVFSNGGSALLKWNNTDRLETTTSGVTVTGTVAATAYTGDGSNLTGVGIDTSQLNVNKLDVSGISTFKGNIDVNADLDVDGHTNLDNVNIAGVTSVASLTSGRVVTVGTGGKLQDNSNLTFDGSNLFVSGINVTSAGTTSTFGADIVTRNLTVTGFSTLSGDLDVDGHTYLDNVTISGVATFSSVVNASQFSGMMNANNLNAGTVPSGRLSGTYNITNSGSAANIVVADESSDAENFVVFTNSATGSQAPKTGTNLKFNASSGALTATSFVGDGSGLSGVTAEGTGIAIKNNDSSVGTASTLNFGPSISVTPVSSGITTVGVNTSQLDVNKFNVSGISTFNGDILLSSSIKHIADTTTSINFPANLNISFNTNNAERLRIGPLGQIGIAGANYGSSGQVLTSQGTGSAVQWTTVASSVGITTNIGGSFTATAGQASTIDTFTGYSSDDKVVEYTIYVKNGSNYQTQKLLVLIDGSTIHTQQFAIMFNSSLLVQCDATISSGNVLLRVTPETGVNGSTNFRVKREVM